MMLTIEDRVNQLRLVIGASQVTRPSEMYHKIDACSEIDKMYEKLETDLMVSEFQHKTKHNK